MLTYVLLLLLAIVIVGKIKIDQIINILESTYGKLALILLLIVCSSYDLHKTAIGVIILFVLYVTAKYSTISTETFANKDADKEIENTDEAVTEKLTDKKNTIDDYIEDPEDELDNKLGPKVKKQKETYKNVEVDIDSCLKQVYTKYPDEFARLIQNMEAQRKVFNERIKGKEKDEDHMAYEKQQFRAYLKLMLEQALNNLDDEDDV